MKTTYELDDEAAVVLRAMRTAGTDGLTTQDLLDQRLVHLLGPVTRALREAGLVKWDVNAAAFHHPDMETPKGSPRDEWWCILPAGLEALAELDD